MAHYDALTGLPSLNLLHDSAKVQLNHAQRHQKKLAVLFIDLDGFKAVNDTWGHDAGDQVLKEIANRLQNTLREADQVSRIGGDEFVVLATEVDTPDNAAEVAGKIIEVVSQPLNLYCAVTQTDVQVNVGASIGIAFYPDHGQNMKALLKAADQSMYQAKSSGKGNFHFT
ncbi:MAG: GGDEF domain-containing protein [Magnetovibrio sp.]|nr:GGDEF domain-containing protein [Magnetovibrio sp.]